VIRIVTLAAYDEGDITHLSKTLYRSFGVGTEHVGERPLPKKGAREDGRYDVIKLLDDAPPVRAYADDKVLYITDVELAIPKGPLGEPPTWGYAEQGGDRAIISTFRFKPRGVTEASIEVFRRRLARESIHFIGHLWDLHHCYDARCAMHPSWSPTLPDDPEFELDSFCRDKSERRIRLAKT
jgi:predicted Zn-dependent protease